MAWNDGERRSQDAFKLFVIASTNAAGFKLKNSAICSDIRNWHVPCLELAWPDLNHGEGSLGNVHLPTQRGSRFSANALGPSNVSALRWRFCSHSYSL